MDISKKETRYFEVDEKKYKLKYVNTYYDFVWVSVKRKIFLFFYKDAIIHNEPQKVKRLLSKIIGIMEEIENSNKK